MRFLKNLYKSALVLAAGIASLTACQPEESPLSRAILTSVSGLQFAAQNAEPQVITVYADAEWTVEAPDWVSVDVTSGSRSMDVTISVADNMRDGAVDNPKKDTIVFRGYNLLANAYVIVSQDGDKFRDVPVTEISGVLSMKDEEVVILDDAKVVAVTTNGYVVSDGTASVFVADDTEVNVGDLLDIWGSKGTLNELAAVTVVDKVEAAGTAEVTYPTATDITASFDAFAPAGMDYIEFTGLLNGNIVAVSVDEVSATKQGVILDAPASLGLAELNGHNITVRGYAAGVTVSVVNIIATEIIDLGANEIIYFADTFDWVAEFAAAAGAGDSMGADSDNNAKNAYTTVEGFADALAAQGYEDLFPSSKTIYLQTNYLKFSKGKNTNGIRLPAVEYGGTTNIVLTFDWGIHVGSGGQDEVELVLEVEGNGAADKTNFTHSAGEWEWQTETVTISGVDNNTRIVLKPSTFTGVVDAGYYRWYLDNIKIIDAGGAAVVPPAGGTSMTLATFPFPYDTAFDGTGEGAGTAWNLEEGWLLSEDGASKISAHKDDGTALKVTYKYEASTDEGLTKDHVRILATGMPKGGYWLFEVPVTDMPAGTYNITYNHSASATGPNYFLLEVSLDGQNWAPVASQTTTETFKDGSSGREVTWTYALNKGGVNAANIAYNVNVNYEAPALSGTNTLYVRAMIADDMAYGSEKAMGAKGTNRIWGPCEITFAE